jgi:hypothetical protein
MPQISSPTGGPTRLRLPSSLADTDHFFKEERTELHIQGAIGIWTFSVAKPAYMWEKKGSATSDSKEVARPVVPSPSSTRNLSWPVLSYILEDPPPKKTPQDG